MRLREFNIVWRSGFTLANARNTPKPRRKSAGKIAIQKALVLTTESIQEFEALYSAHYNHHQPQGEIESGLVNDIATALWRVRRMQHAETETLNAAGNAPGALGQAMASPVAEAISREEDRCSNQMLRASAVLRKIITSRKQIIK
jgi:hypothetical protein